jgi:serine/threonine protein kinase
MIERGQHLGRYRLVERIGVGGMGTVYKAHDERSGATVAVKILHPHLASDPSYVRRFAREARVVRGIDSPNVVRVLDFGRQGELHFLVMEYLPGQTLAERIEKQGRLSIEDAVHIAASVAHGLAAAHANGIVHRDISPQNVIITPSGEVKVADFGVARDLGMTAMTATNMLLGKPQYVAPEVVAGRAPPDIRADIYALGVVLYQMLAGEAPFAGDTPYAVMQKHVNEAPPPLGTVRREVPEWLRAVVGRCLAKDPRERYQTPQAMLAALGTLSAGSIGAAAPQVPQRRSRAILLGVAGLGVLAVASVFFIALTQDDHKDALASPGQALSDVSEFLAINSLGCDRSELRVGEVLVCNPTVSDVATSWAWSGGGDPATGSTSLFLTAFVEPGPKTIELTACKGDECAVGVLTVHVVSDADGLAQIDPGVRVDSPSSGQTAPPVGSSVPAQPAQQQRLGESQIPTSAPAQSMPSIASLGCSPVVEAGRSMTCRPTTTNGVSFTWSGGGTPFWGNESIFTTTFPTPGPRSITLRVCSAVGCTTATQAVEVILPYHG